MTIQKRFRLRQFHRQRLSLLVIITQHQGGNFVGHFFQQRIALLFRHIPALDDIPQQNLDIHLVVGTIHTGRVINGIGVNPPTQLRKLNTGSVGHAQIGPFANDLCAHFIGINPQCIIGAIPDIRVAFIGMFHIGPDTAEPQQVHWHPQRRLNQLRWWHRIFRHLQHCLHFRR